MADRSFYLVSADLVMLEKPLRAFVCLLAVVAASLYAI